MTVEPATQDKASTYFEEARSAEVVNARMGADVDPRIKTVMASLVTHLHDFVKDVSLTSEEWFEGIRFLTAVGHTCTDWRQEFILLSDTLGVSMLVDAINHHRPEGSTENTVLGPFHVAGAPRYMNGANICLDGKGEPLVVRGKVVDHRGNPVAGVTLDTWQANDEGFYDVQQRDKQPAFNLRGVFESDEDGRYWFRSIKPRYYPIPYDGPVGEMLKTLGRHPNRAAHLHFIVMKPGYDTVVTHIFTPDCTYLPDDAVFGVKDSLIADFRHVDDAAQAERFGVANPFWLVEWDFVLAPKAAGSDADWSIETAEEDRT
ncbi:intradiol ring-cleavage dioxygenase [Sphingomonas sp. Leaf25]|uniref:intradiol ring-cleavage dioxygenase n=1 Tax=Sphingomonas sp. Leaf25 TaxID=1735692 RepID=UPI0006F9D0AD|nr:intradiol ring-cleavage dioxygenase [Sphingomonas sp. Leaf25]KQM99390.1 6-chlorohydroxyquinol-1,2-dioxygenase [Sphingomonas sp. Leaf25]